MLIIWGCEEPRIGESLRACRISEKKNNFGARGGETKGTRTILPASGNGRLKNLRVVPREKKKFPSHHGEKLKRGCGFGEGERQRRGRKQGGSGNNTVQKTSLGLISGPRRSTSGGEGKKIPPHTRGKASWGGNVQKSDLELSKGSRGVRAKKIWRITSLATRGA